MSSRVLVCPFDERLLSGFHGQTIVIRLNDPQQITAAAHIVSRQNALHAIMLESTLSLDTIPLEEAWGHLPLALYTPGPGNFRAFINRLPLIRKMNMRVFLSADEEKNYTTVRLLSSLKIAAGLVFVSRSPDWDALSDLMHYAVYSKVSHAAIEPFQ